jgi:hypothetical protein
MIGDRGREVASEIMSEMPRRPWRGESVRGEGRLDELKIDNPGERIRGEEWLTLEGPGALIGAWLHSFEGYHAPRIRDRRAGDEVRNR